MKDKTHEPHCPHCAKMVMKPSRPRGRRDRVMSLIGFSPVRCHNCRYRSYVRANKLKTMSSDAMESVPN